MSNGTSSQTVPLLINGKEVQTETTFSVESPGEGKTLWQSSSCSVQNATDAVNAAQAAFPAWSSTKPSQRRAIFNKAADLIDERADELRDYHVRETGAVKMFADFNVNTMAEMLRDLGGRIAGAMVGSIPTCGQDGTSAVVLKEPYGVNLGIAPWYVRYSPMTQASGHLLTLESVGTRLISSECAPLPIL